jgi:hypothetical protein
MKKVNILELIKTHGADNLRFAMLMRIPRNFMFMKYTNSSDPEFLQICRITESRHKLKDNYKISLEPENKEISAEHFYISDLNLLIEQGSVRVFVEV